MPMAKSLREVSTVKSKEHITACPSVSKLSIELLTDQLYCFIIVSRIQAESRVNKLKIELDVNTDIYPMTEGAFYSMVLATSLNADGHENFDIIKYENEGTASGMGSLLEQYDYVMHGKIFKYQHDGNNQDVM